MKTAPKAYQFGSAVLAGRTLVHFADPVPGVPRGVKLGLPLGEEGLDELLGVERARPARVEHAKGALGAMLHVPAP